MFSPNPSLLFLIQEDLARTKIITFATAVEKMDILPQGVKLPRTLLKLFRSWYGSYEKLQVREKMLIQIVATITMPVFQKQAKLESLGQAVYPKD